MIKIVVLYQSLLGIYGDRGNAVVCHKRLQWRGIESEIVFVEPGDDVPADGHLYLVGGGEDQAQVTAVRLLTQTNALTTALDGGAVLFAVCAGYQMCGATFTVGHDDRPERGLGLLDVETRRGPVRAVGELLTSWTKPDGSTSLITGFENHGGYTSLGADASPLATVVAGIGNDGGGTEGAVSDSGRIIGTYPHGPVLARNPDLADHLLTLATGVSLAPLDLSFVEAVRKERMNGPDAATRRR